MASATGLYFVGEAIADLRTSPNDARSLNINLGGSSYFGSIGAAHSISDQNMDGVRSFYVGPVSEDLFGGLFMDDFNKAGVCTDYVRTINYLSMLAVVSTSTGQNKFEFYGRQKSNTVDNLSLDHMVYDLKEEGQLFCVGSVVMTVPHARDAVTEYITRKTADGHVVYFDPNTRPSIIEDKQAYLDRILMMSENTSLVRFSEEDVAWCYPDETHEAVAKRFLDHSDIAVLIITHGGGGCTVFSRDGHCFIDSFKDDRIVFTVGAGDNFNAGVLVALAKRGLSRKDSLKDVSMDEWEQIAKEANKSAYNHLLRVNNAV
jgi:fructokinase